MRKEDIRQFVKEHGVVGFVDAYGRLLEGRQLPNGAVQRIEPMRQSFAALWEALVGPIDVGESLFMSVRETGALDATGFPTVAEKLISTIMIKGYESRRTIADILVPETYDPKTLTERIPGFTHMSSPKNVLPGEPYPTGTFTDKFATYEAALHNKKDGIMIPVTEETIRFDQTGMILRHAQNIGMTIQDERERRTVRAILGIGLDTGTAYNGVYFPLGVDTALYRASRNNLRTNAAPIYNHPLKTANSVLEDFTDVQEVLATHAQNIKDDRDLGTTRPIAWQPNTLLHPVSLTATVANIFQGTTVQILTRGTTAASDPEVRVNAPNPLVTMFSAFGGTIPVPVTSAYADEVSSTAWVLYDRNAAFVRVQIFPLQVFRSPTGWGWDRDIVVAFRAREWSRIVAIDDIMAVRNDGA